MAKKDTLSRRDFLGKSGLALGAVAALPALPAMAPAAGTKLPHRVLGRTGVEVPILAFGCGSRFLMYEAEEAGLAALNRAIDLGITYLDTDIDCVQMAMNPARANRFEELALPAARAKNLGVILMKVTAQEKLLGAGKAETAALLRYAWSLPVSTVVCGMPKPEFVESNVASARDFTAMPAGEMDRLPEQLAGQRVVLEQFFARHRDCRMA